MRHHLLLTTLALAAACADEAASFTFNESAEATFPALPEGVEVPTTIPTTIPTSWNTTQLPTTLVGTETIPEGVDPFAGLDQALDLSMGPEQIAELGIEQDDVSRIVMRDVGLKVLVPAGGDLSFVESLELWISADGEEDLQLVAHDAFDAGVGDVHPVVVDADLRPYVFGEGLVLTPLLDGVPPPAETTVQIALEVEVGVTWQGILNRL